MLSFFSNSIPLRTLFVIGFILSMGLLSLPIIARQTDYWLYTSATTVPELEPLPEPPKETPLAPKKPTAKAPLKSQAKSLPNRDLPNLTDPAPDLPNFEKPIPSPNKPEGVGQATFEEPAPPQDDAASTSIPAPEISDEEIQKLETIRQELVQAGASDIRLEWLGKERKFVFRCTIPTRSSIDQSTEFSAMHASPYEAGQRVLRQVLTTPVE